MLRIKNAKALQNDVSSAPAMFSSEVLDFSQLPDLRKREEIAGFAVPGAIGVELGVASGSFSNRLLSTGRFSHLYSIDMWAGDRGHDVKQYKGVLRRLAPYKEKNSIIKLKFDEALDLFPDEYFDFIYIDGYAHTGQNSGQTLHDWWPKLKRGGVFSGDDYSDRYPLVIKEVDEFAQQNGLQVHIHRPKKAGDKLFQHPSWITRKP